MLEFHHIGVGTTRFEEAIERYLALGHRLLLRVDDPRINVRVAFVHTAGAPLIEIVAPLGAGGPLHGLIARKVVPGPYHTCYAVRAMSDGISFLRARGFMPVTEPTPAVAFNGQCVAFFVDRDVGLVELVEQPPPFPILPDSKELR